MINLATMGRDEEKGVDGDFAEKKSFCFDLKLFVSSSGDGRSFYSHRTGVSNHNHPSHAGKQEMLVFITESEAG